MWVPIENECPSDHHTVKTEEECKGFYNDKTMPNIIGTAGPIIWGLPTVTYTIKYSIQ